VPSASGGADEDGDEPDPEGGLVGGGVTEGRGRCEDVRTECLKLG
jgi:hypothetical protein